MQESFDASELIQDKWCRYWVERRMAGLERALETTHGEYCHGNLITMADVYLFPQVKTSERFETDLAQFKNVMTIMDNLETHPAFAGSFPPQR